MNISASNSVEISFVSVCAILKFYIDLLSRNSYLNILENFLAILTRTCITDGILERFNKKSSASQHQREIVENTTV